MVHPEVPACCRGYGHCGERERERERERGEGEVGERERERENDEKVHPVREWTNIPSSLSGPVKAWDPAQAISK